eukprot:s2127_g22.t1
MMNGSGVARANMSTHDRVSLSHVAPQKEVLLVEQRHLHRVRVRASSTGYREAQALCFALAATSDADRLPAAQRTTARAEAAEGTMSRSAFKATPCSALLP